MNETRNERLTRVEYSWTATNNAPPTITKLEQAPELLVSSRSGVENPKWYLAVRDVRQAGTSFTGTRRVSIRKPFNLTERWQINPTTILWAGNYGLPLYTTGYNHMSPAAPSEEIANQLALQKFARSCKEAQTAFRGGVFLGELAKTFRMLLNPVSSLRRSIEGYTNALGRVRRIPSVPSRRSALRDTYLEWTFGWVPLILETQDALEASWRIHSNLQTTSVFGEGEHKTTAHGTWGISNASYTPRYTILCRTEKRTSVRYKGVFGTEIDTASGIARQVGIHPSDFLPTAWELLPYSWVADYFANVGLVLDAMSVNTTQLRWAIKTVKKETITKSTDWIVEKTHPNASIYANEGGYVECREELVQRDPYTGSIVPDFAFRNGLTWRRGLNIAAIIPNLAKLCPFF